MIDRTALTERHSPRYRSAHPRAPLSVGNGEFAMTVDATGLQTFPADYSYAAEGGAGTLLGTQAQWGWHTTPSSEGATLAPRTVDYTSHGRQVPYVDLPEVSSGSETTDPADAWRRENPHRLHLGLLGLDLGEHTRLDELDDIDQRLALSTGILTSAFRHGDASYRVTCAVHPVQDAVAVRVERRGGAGPLALTLRLPYGSGDWSDPADWSRPDAHRTRSVVCNGIQVLERELDDARYRIVVSGPHFAEAAPHHWRAHSDASVIEAVLHFAADEAAPRPTTVAEVLDASAAHWHRFWNEGGVVDLSASTDDRALELERRVVLSQYLTAINCAGSMPPAETGLLTNSWRGKFHLEMHWWHAAHFPQWGRADMLERSLGWYELVLPRARETARAQGFAGARWPKQVGPQGIETPSDIGPFLLWQQPHPIHLAELVRRADPGALERYAEIVDESAAFLVDVVVERGGEFHLDGPLIPAQESYTPTRATNSDPTFELAYWRWALLTAARWRELRGAGIPERWMRVAERMARPAVRDGVYLGQRVEPTLFRDDHPSHLAALGVVPDTGFVDHRTMEATLDDVLADWHWPSTWGWDYPVMAMTATRLGRSQAAVDALLLDAPKNLYLPNGHNFQTPSLPVYLPGNGGLLAAVGLMAAGWGDAAAETPPGFPAAWGARAEDIMPMP